MTMGEYSQTKVPGTITENITGGSTWTNEANCRVVDAVTGSSLVPVGSFSATLDYTNLGAVLPWNCIITGYRVDTVLAQGDPANTVELNVSLLLAGALVGDLSVKAISDTSLYTLSMGGDGDLWGAVLTRADVIAKSFGARIYITNDGSSAADDLTIVDGLTLTVWHNLRRGLSSQGSGQ